MLKMNVRPGCFFAFLGAAAFAFAGCNKPSAPSGSGTGTEEHAHEHGDEHEGHAHTEAEDHGHGAKGPHGGDLIELGAGEIHAELVHDDSTKSVVVYLLDKSASKALAISADHVVINVVHDGKGQQFDLQADPEDGNATGTSSRFAASNGELVGDLDHEHGGAELVIEADGKQYRGKVDHHHDHEESSH